jgi:hypothetical protein
MLRAEAIGLLKAEVELPHVRNAPMGGNYQTLIKQVGWDKVL